MKTFCFISGLLVAWLFNMAGLPEMACIGGAFCGLALVIK